MYDDSRSGTDSTEETELEQLEQEIDNSPTADSPYDEPTSEDVAAMESVLGGTDESFPLSDKAQSLRSNPTVQKTVQDIRDSHSADEIAALMAKNPNEVPSDFIDESAFDYAVVENGDTVIGTPLDVASAVWAELHAGSSSTTSSQS